MLVDRAPTPSRTSAMSRSTRSARLPAASSRTRRPAEEGWVEAPGTLREGMFAIRVQGRSMEPTIPDGAIALFVADPSGGPLPGSREGKIVLAQLHEATDPEDGGSYTVKRYHSEKAADEDGSWRHTRIVLQSLNREVEDIELEPEMDVDVIAEFVAVLGARSTTPIATLRCSQFDAIFAMTAVDRQRRRRDYLTQEEVGPRIAELRQERGVSQRRLADAIGVDPSAMSRIESGQRGLAVDELVAIADFLGVTTDDASPPRRRRRRRCSETRAATTKAERSSSRVRVDHRRLLRVRSSRPDLERGRQRTFARRVAAARVAREELGSGSTSRSTTSSASSRRPSGSPSRFSSSANGVAGAYIVRTGPAVRVPQRRPARPAAALHARA